MVFMKPKGEKKKLLKPGSIAISISINIPDINETFSESLKVRAKAARRSEQQRFPGAVGSAELQCFINTPAGSFPGSEGNTCVHIRDTKPTQQQTGGKALSVLLSSACLNCDVRRPLHTYSAQLGSGYYTRH